MAVSDPIADFLTRIRNGLMAEHRFTDIPWNKMVEWLAGILKEEGFIENYIVRKSKDRGTMRVFLRYAAERKPVIQQLRRVSKPGLRKYVSWKDIQHVRGGMGISIVSTSKGVMVGRKAYHQKIGGELLCTVW